MDPMGEDSIEEFGFAINIYKKVMYLMAEGFTWDEAIDRAAADLD